MTAAEIAELLAMPLSTVSAILARIGLGKRSRLEPPEPPNRYERSAPGELVHVDVHRRPPAGVVQRRRCLFEIGSRHQQVDVGLREQLAAGRIVIDPLDGKAIQPSSVDLRLDRLDLDRLGPWTESSIPLDGRLRGTLSLDGPGGAMRTEGELTYVPPEGEDAATTRGRRRKHGDAEEIADEQYEY